MRTVHRGIRPLALLMLSAVLPIHAADSGANDKTAGAPDTTEQLEPIIVEGQQSPLDSKLGRYRDSLPCIGECPDEEARASQLQQMLDNIKMMFVASQMLEKPEIYQRAPIAAPVDSRLNDKLP
jgi:hypothetical protein